MTRGEWQNTAQGQFPENEQQVEVLFAGQLEFAIYYSIDKKYWLSNRSRILFGAEESILWRSLRPSDPNNRIR